MWVSGKILKMLLSQRTWSCELYFLPLDLKRGVNELSEQVGLCMVFVMPSSCSVLWFSGDLATRVI